MTVCSKCGGDGWIWWYQSEHTFSKESIKSYLQTKPRFTCEQCKGDGEEKYNPPLQRFQKEK